MRRLHQHSRTARIWSRHALLAGEKQQLRGHHYPEQSQYENTTVDYIEMHAHPTTNNGDVERFEFRCGRRGS